MLKTLQLFSSFRLRRSLLQPMLYQPQLGPLLVNFADVLCSNHVVGDPHEDLEPHWSEAGTDRAREAVSRFWHEDPISRGSELCASRLVWAGAMGL